MKVLLIKMSSMGDVIHTLPAVSDAMRAIPGITIDWVVEESYTDISKAHAGVHTIIPIAWRRWRKNIIQYAPEIKSFFQTVRNRKYEVVIDAQGLLKSALLSQLIHGETHGFDRQSARDKWSSYFYDHTHSVSDEHAITKIRALFAKIFHYSFQDMPLDYGVQVDGHCSFPLKKPYYIFFHGTTWESKHYPDIFWRALIEKALTENVSIYLPWGNQSEKNRADAWALEFSNVTVLPKLSIAEMMRVIKQAVAAVGVDTGFTHLSAALSTPCVGLYGPTSPSHVGLLGNNQINLSVQFACAPCYSRQCAYAKKNSVLVSPTCFTSVNPSRVWEALQSLQVEVV